MHRDVKLENILLDDAGTVRLIDFGLCGYYVAGKRLRCHCGSPSYAAPEIVARQDYLGPPVDVWSLGVVLFAMLAGYLPFHAKDKKVRGFFSCFLCFAELRCAGCCWTGVAAALCCGWAPHPACPTAGGFGRRRRKLPAGRPLPETRRAL